MLGNVTAWFLIDRVGRRGLTLWGMCTLTVLLMITGGLAVAATPGAVKGTVALLLVYCYIYNVTIGATAYSLLTEVATSRLRAKTASMALALQNSLFVSRILPPKVILDIVDMEINPLFPDHVGLCYPLPFQPRPSQSRCQGGLHLRRPFRSVHCLSLVLPTRGCWKVLRGAR